MTVTNIAGALTLISTKERVDLNRMNNVVPVNFSNQKNEKLKANYENTTSCVECLGV